jgi:hypothetical protein
MSHASLQLLDTVDAQPSSLGKPFLRQSGSLSVLTQQIPEAGSWRVRHNAFTDAHLAT